MEAFSFSSERVRVFKIDDSDNQRAKQYTCPAVVHAADVVLDELWV